MLGYNLTDIMFEGSDDDLKQTIYTQPAVFLHGVVLALTTESFAPDQVAGHSLGELAALTAAGVLSFDDGLRLASVRATAMQRACELVQSTMAAVLGLPDAVIEQVCTEITEEIVVPANYNCPGQVVISGSVAGIQLAEERLKAAGAKRVVLLAVGRGVPFALYGTGSGGICRCRSADAIYSTALPRVSERRCPTNNRPGENKGKPDRSVNIPCSVDAIC